VLNVLLADKEWGREGGRVEWSKGGKKEKEYGGACRKHVSERGYHECGHVEILLVLLFFPSLVRG
jgi:hypothetical protein